MENYANVRLHETPKRRTWSKVKGWGHCIDLPPRVLAVDSDFQYICPYEQKEGRKAQTCHVHALKSELHLEKKTRTIDISRHRTPEAVALGCVFPPGVWRDVRYSNTERTMALTFEGK